MREDKECAECGGIFFRGERVTIEQWAARKYCSASCGGKAAIRHQREKRTAPVAAEEPVAAPAAEPATPERAPVLRQLRVVRVGPNPRLISCEYWELAQRRMCTVLVKRNQKFVRGMSFEMAEPASEAAYIRPWVYQGAAPRRRGRW